MIVVFINGQIFYFVLQYIQENVESEIIQRFPAAGEASSFRQPVVVTAGCFLYFI